MPFPQPRTSRGQLAAFTLIELLVVISIIIALSAIGLTVAVGVNQRSAITKTRTELAVLAQALEEYKRQYGDYPQTGLSGLRDAANRARAEPALASVSSRSLTERQLFNALTGKLGPKLDPLQGRQFIDLANFSLYSSLPADLPTPGNATFRDNFLLDAWGSAYVYCYRTNGTGVGGWAQPSYILFSVGPDGLNRIGDPGASGAINLTDPINIDNIYANR
jgi:type II secretory pathway pseudopilin PulG